jgi:LysR family nitrogen assimilation transcriptional regulator
VQLELTEELTGNLSQQLTTRQLNLAVLFDDANLPEFKHTSMLSERMYLIEPAQPGKQARRRITLKQALSQPLVLPASPHGVRPIIEAAALQAGVAAPLVEADISSISILRTSLLAGMGRTLLPVMPLRQEIEAGLLWASEIVDPPLERVLAICWSRHIPVLSASQAVIQLTQTLVAQLCAEGQWLGGRLVSEQPNDSTGALYVFRPAAHFANEYFVSFAFGSGGCQGSRRPTEVSQAAFFRKVLERSGFGCRPALGIH